MRRLSATAKSRHDGYFLLAVVALVLVAAWLAWRTGHSPSWGVLVPILAVLPARTRRLLAADLVDEAWVDGGDLLLKRGKEAVRVPLDNIAAVEAERQSDLVTLELRLPCTLGNQVRFIARRGSARDIGDELRQRADEERRHA